jgi:hypothetical protein
MAEYIEREATIEFIRLNYCKDCNNYNGILCRSCSFDDAMLAIEDVPAADVVPVVRCKDCVYCVDLGTSGLYCDHDDNRNPLGCRSNDYCNDGERRCEDAD